MPESLFLFSVFAGSAIARTNRPTVLFAISDDQAAMYAGAYGNLITPKSQPYLGRENISIKSRT